MCEGDDKRVNKKNKKVDIYLELAPKLIFGASSNLLRF